MNTVAMILELAAPLQAGFNIRIENEPWMTLVIEDTQERGPNGRASFPQACTATVSPHCARFLS